MAGKRAFNIPFPTGGLDESQAYSNQPEGSRDRPPTTVSCNNVRAFDPLTDRARGGSRPGLSNYYNNAGTVSIGGASNKIKHITHVALSTTLSGSATSAVTRTVRLLVISAATLYKVTATSASAVTNNSGSSFNANAPVMFSAEHFSDVYFVDGTTVKFYDSSADTLETWTPSSGSLPTNGGAYCTLICNWRGRIVLSGLAGDRQNWFMSKLGDALDWNYSPTYRSEAQAVAGNNALAGKSPDIINCLIPVNDDVLLFGCDHSIWMLRGDPMAGGRIDLVSDSTGMPWGNAWCKDANGTIYFFGNRGGVFAFTADGGIQEISTPIHDRFLDLDLSARIVTMVYSPMEQGIYIFVSLLTQAANQTHYFFDLRNRSWWPMSYVPLTAGNFDPVAVHLYDGDAASDRVLLVGGFSNGQLYKIDPDADDDSAQPISSNVWLGPIRQPGGVLYELQATLGANSDAVTYGVYSGNSAEQAFNSSAAFTGTWSTAGRNYSERQRCFGDAIYIKLSNTTADKSWTFEKLTAVVKQGGRTRQRHLQ
jgi:hypothetical protein